ncbi:PREDICTED: single-strand selective monofunctional uracil DNA glycosylase [Condylura cristata]|uniref:single-strand selective monofunctional uracil DNA glycosylase n=1 Tax=Condylura cristata TaxID=143302 RepID=UPI0006436733|nr:PREDICTED: single-strand selective monofunctional uracil DNA glycosylase [Condylura cristata]
MTGDRSCPQGPLPALPPALPQPLPAGLAGRRDLLPSQSLGPGDARSLDNCTVEHPRWLCLARLRQQLHPSAAFQGRTSKRPCWGTAHGWPGATSKDPAAPTEFSVAEPAGQATLAVTGRLRLPRPSARGAGEEPEAGRDLGQVSEWGPRPGVGGAQGARSPGGADAKPASVFETSLLPGAPRADPAAPPGGGGHEASPTGREVLGALAACPWGPRVRNCPGGRARLVHGVAEGRGGPLECPPGEGVADMAEPPASPPQPLHGPSGAGVAPQPCPPSLAEGFLEEERRLNAELKQLQFSEPVGVTYNPVEYAWAPHHTYVTRYCQGPKEVLFLGMNPGPFGMAQTGVGLELTLS